MAKSTWIIGGLAGLALLGGAYYLGKSQAAASSRGAPEMHYNGESKEFGKYTIVYSVCPVIMEKDVATGDFIRAYDSNPDPHNDVIKMPAGHKDSSPADAVLLVTDLANKSVGTGNCRLVTQDYKRLIKP